MAAEEFWVFGYGSLIWNPGFPYLSRQKASLGGFNRSFCMASIHYRGTPEAPGLVLALDHDPDAECHGVAYHVAADHAEETISYLRERELISSAYLEQRHRITLEDRRQKEAVCYVINRDHHQYRGGMAIEDQVRIIARAIGSTGQNAEYLHNTVAHLLELGIEDKELLQLDQLVRQETGNIRSPDEE